MKRLIASVVFVFALALLLAACAHAAQARDVTIKSVDNYAGSSNVSTSQPNATVAMTELTHLVRRKPTATLGYGHGSPR
jgi:ABC-type oligopeptide transport system substrate-binding subunit